MTASHLIALLPIIAPAAMAIVILLLLGFYRRHAVVVVLSSIGLALGLAALPVLSSTGALQVGSHLTFDGPASFYAGLILAAAFVLVLLSHGYLSKREQQPEEFYVMLLLATAGAVVLAASSHLISFFLGLELLSISLYAMIAYDRTGSLGIEAGVKYLILSAVSAAFLLFGMALIHSQFGTMEFSRIAGFLAEGKNDRNPLVLAGLAMIFTGVAFKMALAPFHLWAADVYQGAPAPVTAFLSTVSKGAVFAILLRYFAEIHVLRYDSLRNVLTIIAIVSMFVGNLLALLQTSVKRILAYSSIAHSGYLVVAVLASGAFAPISAGYYLLAYFVTTLGAWGVVIALSGRAGEADSLDDYRGLAWRAPWLAGVLSAMLLSLAGIPLTAGFVGKFLMLTACVETNLWVLVIAVVATSAIGLFYYLRIIIAMYTRRDEQGVGADAATGPQETALTRSGGLALAGLVFLLLWLGVYPHPFLRLLQSLVSQFQ